MNRMCIMLVAAIFFTLQTLLLLAQVREPERDLVVGVRGRFWVPRFESSVISDKDETAGTLIDLNDDLDTEDSDRIVSGEIWVEIAMDNRICIDYWDSSFDGSQGLVDNITFDGLTFARYEIVDTEMHLRRADLLYSRNFAVAGSMGRVNRLEIGAGLKYIDFSLELDQKTGTIQSASEDVDIPCPVLSVRSEIEVYQNFIETITVELGGSGMALTVGDADGRVLEMYGGISLNIGDRFGFLAAYRIFDIKTDLRDGRGKDEFEFVLDGIEASISIRF